MSHLATPCDPSAIDALLNGALDETRTLVVETHLESCAACRARVDSVAASPKEWDEIRSHLSDDGCEVEDDSRVMSGGVAKSPLGILRFLSPVDDPAMLGRLGAYEISGIIGSGGMGVVLKGFDRSLNRFVAIKVLAPHLAESAAARRRFSREAQAAAAVVHDHVVAIHGVSEANGLPFLVMPYIRGHSLQRRIDDQGVFSVVEILRIGHQVASGLAAAHAQGLVHRDIKPANILLEDGVERLRINDFGLARAADDASLTQSGVIAGTPHFMSPEQSRGEAIDARSDLFSLGSVLYVLCTGRLPFRAETSYGILRRITDDVPHSIREINPEVPGWLEGIINKLLAKKRNERFDSAESVAKLLSECLAHVQQPTVMPLPETAVTLAPRPALNRRKSKGLASALRLVAGGLFAGLGLWGASLMLSKSDPGEDEGNGAAQSSPAGETVEGQSADPSLDWNRPFREIDELARDGVELEERIENWWGSSAGGAPEADDSPQQ